MKMRRRHSLSANRHRRFAFWSRAALVGGGAVAIAGGAVLGTTHSGPTVAHRDAANPSRPMRLVDTTLNEYWLVASDGGIFAFAPFYGSEASHPLNKPVVGMAATPTGKGYWLVASDGGIFTEGDAGFYQSLGNIHLNSPIVGMAATPTGHGYWMVAGDGGIFTFGDAPFRGSLGATRIPAPIVGMAGTPSGAGYWLAGSDGSIYPFGDAVSYGSMRGQHLNRPVVGIAGSPSGRGYWMVGSDGGVFAFGDAGYHGGTGGIHLNKPMVGIAASQTGKGYWLVASDGGVFAFGDAIYHGSEGGQHLNQPVVGMAGRPLLSPGALKLTASSGSVSADGVSQVTLTGQTLSVDPTPMPGDKLAFSVATPGCGSVSPSSGITDLNGQVRVTYTSSSSLKSCIVNVRETSGTLTGSTTVNQVTGPAATVVGTPGASSYDADTATTTGVPATFTVSDGHGHAISGATVDFTTSLAHGSVSPLSGVTNGSGVVSTTLHDSIAEAGVVTGTVHGTAVHGSTGTITITGGSVQSFTVSTPSGVTAGTPYTATANAFDTYGNATNPPAGALSVSGTACDPAPNAQAASCPAPTFSGGTATLHITSYKAQSSAVLTLTDTSTAATGSSNPFAIAGGPATKVMGSSAQLLPVHVLGTSPDPNGLYIKAADAAQSATITLTATDQYANTATGNSDTVTVTLTHGTHTDGGSLSTSSVTLSHGVGTFTYNAPAEVSNLYPTNWGNGTITWADGSLTSVPASVPVTTTNANTLTGTTPSSTTYTADQVDTAHNQLQITYQAGPASGSVLPNVQVDFTSTGFDAVPQFTDCNGNAETSALTAPTGGSVAEVTVCAHPTKVNSTDPSHPSTGSLTGWIDGSYTGTATSHSNSPTITVRPGPVATYTLSAGTPSTNTIPVGLNAFTLNVAAKDAESNATIPTEAYTFTYSKTESVTCGGTTSTAGASIGSWSSAGTATVTGSAYVVNSGVTFTMKGNTTNVSGTDSLNFVAAPVAALTWSTAPATFTADQGNTGVNYAVDAVDAFCNPIGGQAVTLDTSLGNALEAAGFSASKSGAHSFGNGTTQTVTTATSNGANGQAIGRAQFTLFDTLANGNQGTITASVGNVSQPTGTITVTSGKVGGFIVDNPGTQTVDAPYTLTVHAQDSYGNPAQPASATISAASSALAKSPSGDTPMLPTLNAFDATGTATSSDITSYKAQSGASLTVKDTNSSDTAGGGTVQATSTGFLINPGAAATVFATSTSADYNPSTATLNLSSPSENVTFTVTSADDRGNAVSAGSNPTNQSDTVTVTLTGGATPDGGKLSSPPNVSQTGADGANSSVSITISLSGGTGSFVYTGPLLPLAGHSGTITLTDHNTAPDPALTGLPASITVNG